MSYYDDDKNKIRRKKINSSTSISKPLPNDKEYQNKKEKSIKRDKNIKRKNNIREESVRISKKKALKKKKKQKLIKNLLILFLICSVAISAVGSVVTLSAIKGAPKVTKELINNSYVTNNRISINDMPDNLKNAIVSIEDERFYKHKGVDFISLARSVVHNILSETTQGGSTIDMQVSKNLLTSDDKTIKRKLRDMYNASQMNKVMTKEEILEAYLNNIYLGKNAYGVEDGAHLYFGKNAKELNLAQCAMLVGITNNPAKYMEHREAKIRQETVLYKMHELGYITDSEYNAALDEDVPFKSEIE